MKGYIIDDESAPRLILKHLLSKISPTVEIVGESDNLAEGMEAIKNTQIDVLFLDIEMPKNKGLEVLNFLNTAPAFDIVFITAYSEYAIQAFKLSAFDYLLKPIKKNELEQTLLRLDQSRNPEKNRRQDFAILKNNLDQETSKQYLLRTHKEEFVLPVKNIVSLEADGMYTNIVLQDDVVTASKPMKEILSDLPDFFFRSHRSFAVNILQVERPVRIHAKGIKTQIGSFIPLSSRNKERFLEKMHAFEAQ
jgi:two-component system LytT family response regulator